MQYVPQLLNHLKVVRASVRAMGGQALLDVETLVLQISSRGRTRHLHPQFVGLQNGRLHYRPWFDDEASGFIGWRPYLPRSWSIGSNKRLFKEYASAGGLLVLPSDETTLPRGDFVIKGTVSSFGVGVRGPFRTHHLGEDITALKTGEFYEDYRTGRIAKAWYWNDIWAVLELRSPPLLQGDGVLSWRQLAGRRCRGELNLQALQTMARYQDIDLDAIPQLGATFQPDFKYGTPYDPVNLKNENCIDQHRGSKIGEQFSSAGSTLYQGIPEHLRDGIVFTVDAIVDAEDKVWFLEMNANPMIHPDVYPLMLNGAFPPGVKT